MPESNPTSAEHRQTAIVAALRQTRMFAGLPAAELQLIAEGCSIRKLSKGETLFREGDTAEGFYVAQSGSISVYRITPDGKEQIICNFRPPESFAEVALTTVEAYPANAVALEPSQVIVVRRAPFRDLIQRKPELSLQMLSSMSLHLKHLVQTIQSIKGRQIEYRLAEWLGRQSRSDAFELPLSKKVLAGELGVTSETLSRTFARFRREGVLSVEGSSVRVLDRAKLNAYAE